MVLAPVVEELLFRGIPYFSLEYPMKFWGVIVGSVIWALFHGKYAAPFALTVSPFFINLWLGGLWKTAIVIHFMHNLWAISVLIIWWEYLGTWINCKIN